MGIASQLVGRGFYGLSPVFLFSLLLLWLWCGETQEEIEADAETYIYM